MDFLPEMLDLAQRKETATPNESLPMPWEGTAVPDASFELRYHGFRFYRDMKLESTA